MTTTTQNKKPLRKLKKFLLIFFGTIIALMAAIIIFISPLTKYLVEKYDEKYSGRQIKMDWAYVNPFTGYVYLDNLKIYELKSDSIFFSAEGVSANMVMRKLFSKNFIINELVLNKPLGTIIKDTSMNDLNFRDLIERFTPKKSLIKKSPVHFSILSIKINDGTFYYREKTIPINYFIKKVNIESTGFRWDADTMLVKFSFLPGIGKGESSGNFTLNIKNLDYRLATVIKKFDLQFIEQYLKDLSNYGSFKANLDANIKASGNLKNARDLKANGQLAINEFHFGKDSTEDYASFNKFKVGIIDLSPQDKKYIFDSVLVSVPYFKYERYDNLDNIQTTFGKKGSKVSAANAHSEHFNLILEIAKYVEKLAKNFFSSEYKINQLNIDSANFKYNDYSLNEKFAITVNPLFIEADSIEKSNERVNLILKSNLKPYGSLAVDLSINPKDSSDFDLHYSLKKIPLTILNPYLIKYTSFPMDKGTVNVKGVWNVRNGNIKSSNHLVILYPHISERVKNKDSKWIPIPLIMAFVRERREVIDYEMPITGNLKDPKFHLKDVVLDLLKNILVKPPTTPEVFQDQILENEIEELLTLKWGFRQSTFTSDQEKFVRRAANFLEENPKASLVITPIQFTLKEKEHILFYEAKKKFFLLTSANYTEEDSLFVVKMSIKDSSFTRFLNKHHASDLVFTVQEKCYHFVGSDLVNKRHAELVKQREKVFMSYFKENRTENQIRILQTKNDIPFNGFSYFKLLYKGSLPEALTKIYLKKDELKKKAKEEKVKQSKD